MCAPRGGAVAAALSFAAFFIAGPASAAPLASTPIQVRYVAPDDCSSADAFLDAVKRLLPSVRGAGADEATRVIDVAIEPIPDTARARGRLSIAGAGARTIEAASCEEASGLLAFAAALALEGDQNERLPPSEPVAGPSEPGSDKTASPVAPAKGGARKNIALSTGLSAVGNADGVGMTIGAGVLYRRGSFVAGGLGGLGVLPSSVLWSASAAAGFGAQPLPWVRLDVLGTIGIDAYTKASPSDGSGDADASAILPLAGARARASVDTSNVLIGLEASAETDLWKVTRSSTLYPYTAGSPTNRQGTFSVGGPRVALGVFLGTSFDL